MTVQRPLFTGNVIALIWDFDKTLTPDYMQTPLFEHYGVDKEEFWEEVNGLKGYYTHRGLEIVSPDTLYLNHILTYVREGRLEGLSNEVLRELGAKIEFYPGIPQFLEAIKRIAERPEYKHEGIKIEHYVVSTGLRQMILGSKVAPYVDGVWACEFVSEVAPPGFLKGPVRDNIALDDISPEDVRKKWSSEPVVDIGYVIDNTTKTRAVFEINKGANVEPSISVNAYIRHEDRRVPFKNMIYVADGPSDVPVFSVVKGNGGHTFAVYNPKSDEEFAQVNELHRQGRVSNHGPADYEEGSHTHKLIVGAVEYIADGIVRSRKEEIERRTGKEPGHLS